MIFARVICRERMLLEISSIRGASKSVSNKHAYEPRSCADRFFSSRSAFYKVGVAGILASGGSIYVLGVCQESLVIAGVVGVYWLLGFRDMSQTRHTILRNFPVLGRVRYILEVLRPEIRQYFVEADSDSAPFNRMQVDSPRLQLPAFNRAIAPMMRGRRERIL